MFLASDLGSHPVGSSAKGVHTLDDTFDFLRGAKVCQLDIPADVYENVCTLDVAVDDLVMVEILEAQENLTGIHGDHLFGEAAKLEQKRVDTASWDIFQEDIKVVDEILTTRCW